jgi:putative ABC transport system permease protein
MKTLIQWLRRRVRREAEWREEIETHLEFRERWHREHGASPEQAGPLARRQFGNRLRTFEKVREIHVAVWLDILLQDARHAARGFRRSPAFTLVAVLTVAIGVGAATAVFSVVDPLLFRSLPYPSDRQLVSVGFLGPIDNVELNVASSYFDWRLEQRPFQSITAMRPRLNCDLLVGETPQSLSCFGVEANFLPTLGIAPVLGRGFTADDDRPHSPAVALISNGLWRRDFGGNPKVLDRIVTLEEAPVRIVGVLPKDFEMPQLGDADILLPAHLDESLPHAVNSGVFLRTFARLREGVTIDQAKEQMRPLFEESLRKDVPAGLRSEVHLVVRSLRDRQIHDVKAASWMLLGAVLALLLVASTNVANLLLSRAAARRWELAVRAAIGAGRGRLVRQSLIESLMLGIGGGLAGCGLAWGLLRVFLHLAPEGLLRPDRTAIDTRVLAFALAISIGATLLFGIAPALEKPRAETLAGRRSMGPARTLFRRVLIAAQVAISLMLLSGASLFLRSLWKLENHPLGFQAKHLVTASFTLRHSRYQQAAERLAFVNELEQRLRSIPGAGSFALSDSVPPGGGAMGRPYSNLRIAGRPPLARNGGMVLFRWVTPGYFRTMQIPILSGRAFEERGRASGPSPVILSASLARRMFGNEDPVGQQVELDADGRWSPVVGVAGDAKNNGLTEAGDPEYYRLRMKDAAQFGRSAVALFRTNLDAATLARWIRKQVASLDPALPVTVETMRDRVEKLQDRPRFVAGLVSIFAATALLLAAVGLFGVLSFLVTQRTREIGVRMAVGARPADIALQIQKQAGVWTGLGLAAGLAGSLALARTVRGLLFEVSPTDPRSLAAAVAVLVAVAALAAWLPARRAARIDPVVALRCE